MSNSDRGEEMLNHSEPTTNPIEKSTDPLPWLIRTLVEKRADHAHEPVKPTPTEPPKESP